jgi:death-on-curing protein
VSEIIYLTLDHVQEYHAEALTFGGSAGVRSEHLLASAVFQPQQSAFGEDAYPTIADKAAAYCFFIAKNHAFVDGNKRTAVASMLAFLELNGHFIDATDDDIANVIESMASDAISQDEFFHWVARFAKRERNESEGQISV